MVHRIAFRGEGHSVKWEILDVDSVKEELTIQMTGENSEQRFSIPFVAYDAFIRDFARVHESLQGKSYLSRIRFILAYDTTDLVVSSSLGLTGKRVISFVVTKVM